MKTSRIDLIRTAEQLEAINLNFNHRMIDYIKPYKTVAYSTGLAGLNGKLVYSFKTGKFYFTDNRGPALFSLN